MVPGRTCRTNGPQSQCPSDRKASYHGEHVAPYGSQIIQCEYFIMPHELEECINLTKTDTFEDFWDNLTLPLLID